MRSILRINGLLAAGVVACALGLTCTPVNAQTEQTFTFLGVSASGTVADNIQLSVDSGVNFTTDRVIGRYRGSFNGGTTAFNIFCTDVKHNISQTGASFDTLAVLGKTSDPAQGLVTSQGFYENGPSGTPGGLASAMIATDYNPVIPGTVADFNTAAKRASGVAWLGHQYLNSSLSNDQAAGVALAIWDIIQDGGDGLGLGQGTFRARGSGGGALSAAVLADFAGFITEAKANNAFVAPGDNTDYIQAERLASGNVEPDATHPALAGNHKQDFIYQPVPEPAFYQLGALLGLGAIGMIRNRRRKA